MKPISRDVDWQARKPLKPVSDKRKAAQPERRAFVADMLRRSPGCQIGSPICTGRATQVHEAIKRSQGGAIVPGPLATEQGQEFFTSCWACNCLWVEQNDHEARRLGFTKSNPLRRPGLMETKE